MVINSRGRAEARAMKKKKKKKKKKYIDEQHDNSKVLEALKETRNKDCNSCGKCNGLVCGIDLACGKSISAIPLACGTVSFDSAVVNDGYDYTVEETYTKGKLECISIYFREE